MTSRTDALGARTFTDDNQSLLTTVHNPLGTGRVIAYDLHDNAVSLTDAQGVTTTQTFDRLGRLLSRAVPGQGTEQFAYSARGLTAYTGPDAQPSTLGALAVVAIITAVFAAYALYRRSTRRFRFKRLTLCFLAGFLLGALAGGVRALVSGDVLTVLPLVSTGWGFGLLMVLFAIELALLARPGSLSLILKKWLLPTDEDAVS